MSTINKLRLWLLTMMMVGASAFGTNNNVYLNISSEEQSVAFNVNDAADEPYLTVSTTNLTFSSIRGTQTFHITSNVDWTIEVEGGDGWLTESPMIGSGDCKVSVTSNSATSFNDPWHATVIVSGNVLSQSVEVYQLGLDAIENVKINKDNMIIYDLQGKKCKIPLVESTLLMVRR